MHELLSENSNQVDQKVLPILSDNKAVVENGCDTINKCDTAPSGTEPEAINTPISITSNYLPIVATVATFSSQDVILKRLTNLTKKRNVLPMIFEAAARQDNLTCTRLIEEGVDCDILGPLGRSLVHIAAMTGNIQFLSTLDSLSTRVWSTCDQGKIPLDYAAFNNHMVVVKYLVEGETFSNFAEDRKLAILERSIEFARCRGHVGVTDYLSVTQKPFQLIQKQRFFRDAVSRNDITMVRKLLKENISDPEALRIACEKGFKTLISIIISSSWDRFSDDIYIAVKFAVQAGRQDLLKLLLYNIERPLPKASAARWAFEWSVEAGKVQICEYLISSAAVGVHYAFQMAADYGNLHLVRWIFEREGNKILDSDRANRALHGAISCLSLPVVQFLVENGADVNSYRVEYRTALQYVAASGHYDLVRYLVSKGANLDAPGDFPGTGLMISSVFGGNYDVFHYFASLGSFWSDQNSSLGNILQVASWFGRKDMVEDILDSGFDIDAHLEPYGSALILAIQGGHLVIAELLISRGANVNLTTPKFGTALHLAAGAGMGGMVKSLIQAGANMNAEGGEFGTPLQAATANGHELIALYLLDRGAEVNTQGGKYGNALEAARVKGHTLLAKLLLFSGATVIEQVNSVKLECAELTMPSWAV